MKNMTMTMSAVSCVASARPRPATVLLAATDVQGQGTVLSFATPIDVRRVDAIEAAGLVPATDVDLTAIYKTPDVARSRSGRPPV
ncbi:hypothetical protein OO014_17045 [Intrasporangium calvum]|uniref:Uncharacterized protein n=1 Tax=Intrasporangium calvum TaxID=53358 RepID=A0ABT5GL74_9MICO|nr:hypothetical protein [Intrasporangium calvum]MDC5698962.1 hypothetical protein [Intrasporangium calvum]